MAKVEEKKVEEKKVSIETTQKRADEFAAFAAAKDAEEAKPKVEPVFVEVDLRFQHNRIGKKWGPGTVRVEESLGSSLFAADYQCYMSRLREMESQNKNVEILSRGVSVIRPTK